MLKIPSETTSNSSNFDSKGPSSTDLAYVGTPMNVNYVQKLISIDNDMGKVNYEKSPSNYTKGSTNLKKSGYC